MGGIMKPAARTWLVILVAALVAAGGYLFARERRPPTEEPLLAPDISLPSLDGKETTLASLRGRVVAVNFWASWCGPCLQELPELVRIREAYRERCFEILAVTEASAWDDAQAVVQRFRMSYPIVMDDAGEVGHAYGVTGYPRTYLVDAKGFLRDVFVGAIDGGQLERAIEPLLPPDGKSCPGV